MRRYGFILRLMLIVFLGIITSGCLTMIYYSPSVVESGKIHLGYGARTAVSWKALDSSLFFRYGLPNEYDIGIECKTLFVFPTYITLSLRRQFSFQSDYTDAITIGGGFGYHLLLPGTVRMPDEMYAEMSFIKHPSAIRFGVGQFWKNVSFPDGDAHIHNAFFVQGINEIQWNRFALMPYIYYEYVYDTEDSGPDQYKEHLIGIGLSFYFELL
ncbi:MAG: hypothetical protein SVK54_07945 [candidate division WOR-3 bacterium]|nr:hypothetical protein [candidate division WOR-3 bacterium]